MLGFFLTHQNHCSISPWQLGAFLAARETGVTVHATVREKCLRRAFIRTRTRKLRQAVESASSKALPEQRDVILASDTPVPMKSGAWPEVAPAPSAHDTTVPILSKHDPEVPRSLELYAKGVRIEGAPPKVGRSRSSGYDALGKHQDKTL